jgi:hypothetical protein
VLGVFVVTSSPESSSKATTSVNVPPVSMPILIRRALMGTIQPIQPPRWPWQSLPTDGHFLGKTCRVAHGGRATGAKTKGPSAV